MSRNSKAKREARRVNAFDKQMHKDEVKKNQSFNNRQAQNDSIIGDIEYKPAASKKVEALTQAQGFHKSALIHDDLVIAIGSAGTGKTYLASAIAAELYLGNQVKRLILTRPNQEVGKSLGFLPGELDEKYAPYLEPFKKGLLDVLGSNKFKCDFKTKIQAKPLQYMRGETFDDAIMMLDEAQNTTVAEMKMFLTRVGINSKIFITGDINQNDLGSKVESGLTWLVRQIRQKQKRYEIIEYRKEDCVRSGLCKEILELVENEV
jgi:phosphate starvation-inducible protein PhoH and related proteins